MTCCFQSFGDSLTGTIPSELGEWTAFTSFLYIYSNHLTGSIPSQFGRWSVFKDDFLVFSNSLSGSIPSELGAWSAMGNDFSIEHNGITGSIPSELARWTAMSSGFTIGYNQAIRAPHPRSRPRLCLGPRSPRFENQPSYWPTTAQQINLQSQVMVTWDT